MAEPLAEPENKFRTFYHGTYPDRIDSILRTGLDPSYVGGGGGTLPGLNEKDPRPKLFLTTSPSYAEFYANMAAKTSAMAKAKEEGKGWFRQMLAQGTPVPPLRIDLPSDFKVYELAKGLGGHDEHYVTDLIPPEYIKAMNRLEKTSNDLTVLAPKWSERGHLLAALPKHLTDAQEAIKSQQNIDKEMTDLSLIAGAWLKSQQQKELLETRLKRFKETAGYPSMASVLPTPAVVGISNKEQAMNNLNKAAEFGAMMGKRAGTGQQMGTPNGVPATPPRGPGVGGASSGRSTGGPAANTNPFQGFAPRDPQAPPQYNIHNPSPEQAKLNSSVAKQQADASFNSKVNDTLTGKSGPYNNVPGMSDKQREMGNYKDFRQGYQQEKSAPTTKGVKGKAIEQDVQGDANAIGTVGAMLPAGGASLGLLRGVGNPYAQLGNLAWQGVKAGIPGAPPVDGK